MGLFLLLVSCSTPTQPKQVNLSTYALLNPTYDVDGLIAAVNAEGVTSLGIAIVAGNVFGSHYPNLERVLDELPVDRLVVYLAWAGCLRDSDCQSDVVLEGLSEQGARDLATQREGWFGNRYRSALLDIAPFLGSTSQTTVFPDLESNLNTVEHDFLVEVAETVPGLGNLLIGYNPNTPRESLGRAEVYEGHRQIDTPRPCISNNDGFSIASFEGWSGPVWLFDQLEAYYDRANCETNYIWIHSLSNCLSPLDVAPRERVCSENTEDDWRRVISASIPLHI